MPLPASTAPIGIFDSGLGGLSVLRHVRAQLPSEDLLYFADSGYAPYGGRSEEEITARTFAVADFLAAQGAKALVVACNTATTVAIPLVRARHPELPVVAVEPGLKPGAALSKTGIVGLLATERTVRSAHLAQLQARLAQETGARFVLQACPGLVEQVEKGELGSPATARLVHACVAPLLEQGADTLVLGCTHYPFLLPLIEQSCQALKAQPVALVDTGEAIARQLARLLLARNLLRAGGTGQVTGFTSGNASGLASAFSRLLGVTAEVRAITAT